MDPFEDYLSILDGDPSCLERKISCEFNINDIISTVSDQQETKTEVTSNSNESPPPLFSLNGRGGYFPDNCLNNPIKLTKLMQKSKMISKR